ncbi:FAD/NAD(P)-binding domain-containing protein [Massarina eburnea CBS 473.64]|uniref:FAD/NAD(P)-binding domain-containing protein n=1 Tax=Massarina eburnea CBS 473.64 TaxID=1395130 RepID=A0A6A6RR85_9PLEO|nr:FAD/NAD(P)-binding domain-containing protein [Massarina eburnea CBS 473.64]
MPPPPIDPPSPTAQKRLDAMLRSTYPPPPTPGSGSAKSEGKEGSWVPIRPAPLRHPRKLRVVTIGGGISAMNMAYEIIWNRMDLEDVVDHCIYEKDGVLGGTWWVNRYPGVACDVPAHIYTFPFEPNPNWSAFYAGGKEIHEYFLRTVKKYNLDRDVKLSHRIVSAKFDAYEGIWNLMIEHAGTIFPDWCNVLISATGFLSEWHWPDIPGLDSFSGRKMHSAAWDEEWDWRGQSVAVIGNGSSAIQILPEMARTAERVVNFIRSPTWITPGLGSGVIDGKVNKVYSEEEKRGFREVEGRLREHRRRIQDGSNKAFSMFEKDSPAQKAAFESTSQMMLTRLNNNHNLAAKLTPSWEVGCRRVTPGPGYLEAFTQPNVTLTTSPITHITGNGITTSDNTHHAVDAIICATGFNVSHRPAFPLIGLDSTDLRDHWSSEPLSYLSLACPKFPNLFFFSGPNAPVGHGSLMAGLSWTAMYISKWLRKIACEDIKFVVPTQAATDEFNVYGDEIMRGLVWSGGCRSWYKNGRVDGRVTAVWQGHALAYREVVAAVRPEDFDIRWRTGNRWRWMGNGRAVVEGVEGVDLGGYLIK